MRIAFVCVHDAGWSQMAYAFGGRGVPKCGHKTDDELHTDGSRPAERIHEKCRRTIATVGIGLRTPRAITPAQFYGPNWSLRSASNPVGVCPVTGGGNSRD